MVDFPDELAALIARRAHQSKGNPDMFAETIERLAAALGFTIALAADGDAEAIDNLMVGAEAYAHSEAVDKAPLAQLMRLTKRRAQTEEE